MWADPLVETGGALGCSQVENTERGCSYIFGSELASEFLEREGLQCVVRGHQAEEEGYRLFSWRGRTAFPQVLMGRCRY